MRYQIWLSLPLAAALTIPAVAQQNDTSNTTQNQPATAQSADPQTGHQPLSAERHEGFWGRINPMARKKYVQRQMEPIRSRVNELDELTSANAKAIKDVDARAQEGIRLASAKASEADQHAVEAGNRAQAANQLATQAGTRLNTVEQVVGNIDQYQPVTQADIRFRPGQTVLSKQAKEALDQMAQSLNGQKGYIVEVQGYSSGKGVAALENSQRMAQSVVRYLVVNHNVPVYRVYLMGMGNAPAPASKEAATAKTRATKGGRVEVSLLKNNLEQLSASAAPSAMPGTAGGMGGTTAQPQTQPGTGSSNQQPAAPMQQ